MRIITSSVIALLLAGCQHAQRDVHAVLDEAPVDAPECKGAGAGSNGNDCTILVNITMVGTTCRVKVQPDQEQIDFDRGARNKWVLWQIDSNPGGFRFTQQGIAFTSDSLGNFKNCNPVQGGLRYHCKNSNNTAAQTDYPYTVNVRNKDGTMQCLQDPFIRNR
jgi:hypothetical protein